MSWWGSGLRISKAKARAAHAPGVCKLCVLFYATTLKYWCSPVGCERCTSLERIEGAGRGLYGALARTHLDSLGLGPHARLTPAPSP